MKQLIILQVNMNRLFLYIGIKNVNLYYLFLLNFFEIRSTYIYIQYSKLIKIIKIIVT